MHIAALNALSSLSLMGNAGMQGESVYGNSEGYSSKRLGVGWGGALSACTYLIASGLEQGARAVGRA